MEGLTYQILVKAKFAGSMSDTSSYLGILMQTALIIFGGIVIWRASAIYQKKKVKERERREYFETNYSRNWKRNR